MANRNGLDLKQLRSCVPRQCFVKGGKAGTVCVRGGQNDHAVGKSGTAIRVTRQCQTGAVRTFNHQLTRNQLPFDGRHNPSPGCVRLTDVSVVGESPTERKGSHHFHREPCACHREVSGEASVAACAGQAIEPRNRLCRMRRDFPGNRRQHFSAAFG